MSYRESTNYGNNLGMGAVRLITEKKIGMFECGMYLVIDENHVFKRLSKKFVFIEGSHLDQEQKFRLRSIIEKKEEVLISFRDDRINGEFKKLTMYCILERGENGNEIVTTIIDRTYKERILTK